MAKQKKSSLVTIIVSSVIALVLIGGALASFAAVQQTQNTETQAYMGSIPMRPVQPSKLQCGMMCRNDSDCGTGGFCLTSGHPTCPTGKRCAAVVAYGTCRAAACKDDIACSCAPKPPVAY